MKRTLLCLVALFSVLISFGQKENAWKEVEKPSLGSEVKIRLANLPLDYKLFQFNYDKFVTSLTNVPKRGEFFGQSNVIISLPMPNGNMESFRIIEASVFEKSLQDQFPNIRSFAGQGVEDPSKTLRFSISPEKGLSALIRSNSDQATYIIDPYSDDYKMFMVFDKSKAAAKQPFTCSVDEGVHFGPENKESFGDNQILNNADDGTLRTFRLALSCTGEYAAHHGGTLAAVNAAYNTTMTRVNALYEMDFNATMVIVANNNNVIYLNAGTDPYGNTDANYNTEVQNAITAQIGSANYDIGHLFSAIGNNGNAGCIGCICGTNTQSWTSSGSGKGSGFTTSTFPEGEAFDVDYAAHEFGHQFGGNHTFTFSDENNPVNMEPGSGVTIMGYAGITGPTDVANHSIPIFHAGTIQQVTINIKSKTCPTTVATGNSVPVPSAPATKTLPIGTAFKLTGTATDADANDVLSYCWEQVNDATSNAGLCNAYSVYDTDCFPAATKTQGPNFRSFMPKNNGTRYFPRLEDHVANGINGNPWEIVPGVNRTLNFRMTVRDNRLGGGTNESVNTAVTFDSSRGPFLVTSQNTSGISYTQGSTQTVTWSVNSTNLMTGAANVNIKLSTDGGKTFPIILASNVTNNGTANVTIPNVSAPYCRILIEPTGNDFYAINTNDFAIGYTVTTNTACNQYSYSPNLAIPDNASVVGFNTTIPATPGVITDVNILDLNMTHTWMSDILLALNHPDGTQVVYVNGVCTNRNGFNNTDLDSQAANAFNCGANTNSVVGAGPFRPSSTFDVYNGKPGGGTWTFLALDTASPDAGTLSSLILEICTTETTIEEAPNACGVITTTWNGSSWSNGVPLKNVQAIFNGNYSSTGDIEACSVIINTGANVTFNTGHTLIVTNEVTVNGTGTLTIENNAGLRQINGESSNTGNVLVKRSSSPMIRLDYTAWSSPVSGQQLQAFSPNTVSTRFYEYLYTGTNTPTAYQSVTPTNNFVAGKGYMIRAANNSSSVTPTVHSGQFFGVPFNGDFTVDLGKGYNLLGNPYASPINADRFMFDNETLVGALYFWTNTTPASGGVYPQNNFASYTTLGGTAAFGSAKIPNGAILPGQGFYVRAYDFGSALFSNDQRVNASASTQFFKTSSSSTDVEKHRIWLNLNDDNTSYNQILVGYMNGASNGVDNLIDAKVLDASKPMVYNLLNDEAYVIQGKGLPFDDNDIIPLGLQVLESGNYTLGIEQVDGLFASQEIFLKDNETNIIHDLKQGDYQFTTQSGDYKERFELVFKSGTLSADDVVENTISVYANNSGIQINSSEKLDQIIVFDVLGRKLFEASQIQESNFTIQSILSTNQALIVKVKDVNGNTKTQKIVY